MRSLDRSTAIMQSPRTASRVVDGRAVVVVIDTQNLHTLNEVGTFAWERADGRTIGAIADELVATFDVDAERAYADVVRFVEKLVALGALELSATAAIPKGAGG